MPQAGPRGPWWLSASFLPVIVVVVAGLVYFLVADPFDFLSGFLPAGWKVLFVAIIVVVAVALVYIIVAVPAWLRSVEDRPSEMETVRPSEQRRRSSSDGVGPES